MKIPVSAIALSFILYSSCVKRPFVPVNVGREHGNPTTPWVVSHLPEKNQWALSRTKPHNIFQRILCFDYPCRKMIGRRKALMAISFKEFQKRIRKNAKKEVYKKAPPSIKPIRPDTIPMPRESERIVEKEAVSAVVVPILQADSLIVLGDLLFEINSHTLKAEHFSALDSIGKFLLAHPTLEVSVSGHTDSTGNERHNVALSARRAEAVAEYLIDKGAPFDRVSFEGFGSSQPIVGNETEQGRSKNRRVEILIRNPTKK
jgi:outer membrane protein OmpA-like peptidoglycan-associated protein